LPFDPHAFATHSFALPHAAPFGSAQVFATALHLPDRQVACASASLHVPPWRPSLGMATPAALSSTQARFARSQCFVAGQSAST
jgi:hypothetical protein